MGTGMELQRVHDLLLVRKVCSLCCRGLDVVTAVLGWKISYSYWLEESRCVVLVGRLIWDFVSICKRNGL